MGNPRLGDSMKAKIFSVNNPLRRKKQNQRVFEDEINKWLKDNQEIEILHIKQSASGGSYNPSTWLITIWYR
jgi:hypothetical protein